MSRRIVVEVRTACRSASAARRPRSSARVPDENGSDVGRLAGAGHRHAMVAAVISSHVVASSCRARPRLQFHTAQERSSPKTHSSLKAMRSREAAYLRPTRDVCVNADAGRDTRRAAGRLRSAQPAAASQVRSVRAAIALISGSHPARDPLERHGQHSAPFAPHLTSIPPMWLTSGRGTSGRPTR